MADKILLEYELVAKGGDKVVSTVADITQEWEKSEEAMKAALSEKQIESSTEKLSKFNTEVEKTATGFTSAKSELRELEKVITSGKLQGNDLQQAVKRAAQLKDRIGDVRQEINRLASDTRLFDTFVEGGRAVAAAFSVAQGAAALFGEENKDLQKSILRVQGALALLTGAQELANIVTKQGGIATQAYGVALKVVDGIAKVTGLSIAASMAVATAGVTLLVASILGVIAYFSQTRDEAKKLEETNKEIEERAKRRREAQEFADKDRQKKAELEILTLKNSGATKEQIAKAEIRQLKEVGRELEANLEIRKKQFPGMPIEQQKEFFADELLLIEQNKAAIIDKEKEFQKDLVQVKRDAAKEVGLESFALPEQPKQDLTVRELTIIPTEVVIAPLPESEPVELTNIKIKLTPEEAFSKFIDDTVAFLETAKPFVSAFSDFTNSLFSIETSSLQKEKEKQLAIVGDDVKKREEIEKKFAIKQAEAARKQAIANKAFAAFDIILNTAQGIQKTIAQTGFPAAIPFVALAAATGALQLAAVLSRPLPEIPKFEKGVIGLKRGKNKAGIDTIPALLTEGESVMRVAATNKYPDELQAAQDLQLEDLIKHKYLLPALKAANAESAETYDDFNLRRTIKQGQQLDRENSKFIVNGILSGIRETSYNNRKHYANN